jgi:hypothetical protein
MGIGALALIATPAMAAPLHHPVLPQAGRHVNALVAPGAFGRIASQHMAVRHSGFGRNIVVNPNGKNKAGCIYLSLNLSETINIYSSSAPYTLIGTLTSPNGYGWGVSDTKKNFYAGTYADTVDVYNSNCTASMTPSQSLQGSGGGYPYGMDASKKYGVVASDWPNNIVDVWSGNNYTHSSFTDSNEPLVYFVAFDKSGNIWTVGYNSAESQEEVDECVGSGNSYTCTERIMIAGGFPGGIQIDSKGNIYVNNQYGTLYSYTCSGNGPGGCTQTGSFTYSNGTNPLDYTAIALDKKAQNLWGANIYYCSSSYGICGDAQSQSLPLNSATLNGNTPQVNNDEPLGIAVYPPDKV